MDRDSKQAQKLSHSIVKEDSPLLYENINRLWSSLIIDEFIKQGIDHFFLSPGMRNAPLLAAVHYHPEAKSFSGIDERAHAFHALGYAKSSKKPGVLICTSGTAMANYLPAIIEAFESKVPMIVLSADRPPELVYSGANQSIIQQNIFGDFLAKKMDLGTPTVEISPKALRSSIANLIHTGLQLNGPVHLNCPFREPLDNSPTILPKTYLDHAKESMMENQSVQYFKSHLSLNENELNLLSELLNEAKKGLLVVGDLSNEDNLEPIKEFINKLGWPFFLDVTSSLKYDFNLQDGSIPTFDHPEVYEQLEQNKPCRIFHIGGRLVSKHYYRFLEENPDVTLISLNQRFEKEDPSHNCSYRFQALPSATLNTLNLENTRYRSNIDWKPFVQKKTDIIDHAPLTYPTISKKIIETASNDTTLYIGNSTIIRSFDSYASNKFKNNLQVYAHRGVSGIEGFLAAASGCHINNKNPLTLVLGDISFLHDLNSLQYFQNINSPIVIILINNKGGGIFKLLPIAKEKEIIHHLTTPHQTTFKEAAKLFNIEHFEIKTNKEFEELYKNALKNPSVTILETHVDDIENTEIYRRLRTVKL